MIEADIRTTKPIDIKPETVIVKDIFIITYLDTSGFQPVNQYINREKTVFYEYKKTAELLNKIYIFINNETDHINIRAFITRIKQIRNSISDKIKIMENDNEKKRFIS